MTALEKDIINVLTEDARISPKKIAAMLSVDEEQVKTCIQKMEKDGVLVKYTAIVNGEKEIVLGKKTPSPLQCFFINDSPKIDDTAVYEIMSQLTDDVDISDLAQITI